MVYANIGQLERIWRTIEKERASGDFSHRAPNKRSKKVEEPMQVNKIENYFNLGEGFKVEKTGCLISLQNDPITNKPYRSRENTIIDDEKMGTNAIIKIRTESIDETKQNNPDF